jgi:glycerol-3-phosphate acyltransferase PlsX
LLKGSSLNFVGNIEGRDILSGETDVVVCDGFVGNVVLKLAEGMAEAMGVMLASELKADFISRLGTMLALPALKRFKRKVDYNEFGGAPLLGINGVGIISHGGSSAKAIRNAIRTAAEMVSGDVPGRMQEGLSRQT